LDPLHREEAKGAKKNKKNSSRAYVSSRFNRIMPKDVKEKKERGKKKESLALSTFFAMTSL
jgi:hypothetical protein